MCEDRRWSLEVREAAMADVEAIQNLHYALCQFEYENGFDPDVDLKRSHSSQFASYVGSRISEPTGVALVATVDDTVAGHLLASVDDGARGKCARLESMFVLAEYRKKGIGRCLVSEFLSWIQGTGVVAATVAVAPANPAAVGLYRNLGFRDQTLILEVRAVRAVVKPRETPAS